MTDAVVGLSEHAALLGGILGGAVVVAAQTAGALSIALVRKLSEKIEEARWEKDRARRVARNRASVSGRRASGGESVAGESGDIAPAVPGTGGLR